MLVPQWHDGRGGEDAVHEGKQGSKSEDGGRGLLHEPLIQGSDIKEGEKPTSLDSVMEGGGRETDMV